MAQVGSTDERARAVLLDGSPLFTTAADAKTERAVADVLAAAWQCELHHFGLLAPIDWWAGRHGRLIGVLELKDRHHASTHFDTVFLAVRKWLGLMLAEVGLGVPALYVVRFTDGVRWVRVRDVDGRRLRIGGRRVVRAPADREPLIEVPVAQMRPVNKETTA